MKDLIDYVEDPEKTTIRTKEQQDFFSVFSYVENPDKTAGKEYVTAINCLKETALRQMILTKKRYGKTDCYIAWHGYQSFKPEEVTPQLAHEFCKTGVHGNYGAGGKRTHRYLDCKGSFPFGA